MSLVLDLSIAAVILGAIAGAWFVLNRQHNTATATQKDLPRTISAGISDAWDTIKADLPGLVSAEIAQLREDKAVLQAALDAAHAKIEEDKKAHDAALAAVASRVAAAVAASPELPAPPAPAPVVAPPAVQPPPPLSV